MRCFLICWVVLGLFAGAAVADEVAQCRMIHKADSQVYTVRASVHKAAHIILPEPILGKPVNGNVALWQAEGQGNHLFIKPTTDLKDGAETTVVVIGVSNTSYDFRAIRSKTPDYCVEIKNDGALIQGGALAQWQPPQTQENGQLRQQVAQLQEALLKEQGQTRQQIENAMMEYRHYIYTRYDWDNGSGFMGQDIVSDVWDDGRWTYVRVLADNKGLLTAAALVDGKKELIEYQYDRKNKIYKIVGIYPELFLRYGDSEITVTRETEQTAGAF